MIEWNDVLLTGHRVVDDDHKQLIATLNELDEGLRAGAGQQQAERIIGFLNQYARDHFAREEAHMGLVGCPSLGKNCQEHREFERKLDGWVTRLRSGPSTALVLEVYRETSNWIRRHIIKVDCELRRCPAKSAAR